jgi:hypothetical protein
VREGEVAWAHKLARARADVAQKVQMLCSLRKGNNRMATLVNVSLWFEVTAIGLLSISVGFELYTVL